MYKTQIQVFQEESTKNISSKKRKTNNQIIISLVMLNKRKEI
jgi:hypothetical protein